MQIDLVLSIKWLHIDILPTYEDAKIIFINLPSSQSETISK